MRAWMGSFFVAAHAAASAAYAATIAAVAASSIVAAFVAGATGAAITTGNRLLAMRNQLLMHLAEILKLKLWCSWITAM